MPPQNDKPVSAPIYEDEIDLRELILFVWHHWYWPVGGVFLFAIVAALVSAFVLSPTYEATSLVVVMPAIYQPENEFTIHVPTKSLPQWAISDEVLKKVFAQVSPSLPGLTVEQLKKHMSAKIGDEPNVIQLQVRGTDPQWIAHVANIWAEILAEQGNEIYGRRRMQESIDILEKYLAQAQIQKEQAELALASFDSQSRLSLLRAQLEITRIIYNRLQVEFEQLSYLTQNIRMFRSQVAAQPPKASLRLSEALTMLLLQARVYGVSDPSIPFQIQTTNIQNQYTYDEALRDLDWMLEVITTKQASIKTELNELEKQILDLQQQIARAEMERTRLQNDLQIALQRYQDLVRKVNEIRLALETAVEFKVVSKALVPQTPVKPNLVLNTTIAGVLGGMLGLFGAFLQNMLGDREET